MLSSCYILIKLNIRNLTCVGLSITKYLIYVMNLKAVVPSNFRALSYIFIPSTSGEAVKLVTYIREVPCSDLARGTTAVIAAFSVSLGPSRQSQGYYLKLGHGRFILRYFLIIINCHPIISR
jgi:hypothetical protein